MLIIWAMDKKYPRNTFSKAYLIVSIGIFAIIISIYLLIMLLFLFLTFFIATTV